MQFVKGPDFPTGASILGRAGIMDAYRTGRGSLKLRATATIEENKKGAMEIIVTELPVPDELLVDRRRGSRSSSTAATSTASPTSTTTRRAARPSSSSRSSATATPTSCSTTSTSSPSCSRRSRSTWSRSSTGVPRTLNLVQALQGYVDHQVDVRHPPLRVPPQAGPGARAHPRGPDQGAQRHRRDHRPDPGERGRQRGEGRPDGRAVRVLRGAGRRHPRHAAAPPHPAVPHRPRDRAGRDPRDHQRAAGDPQRPGSAAHRDQGRDVGDQGEVRHAAQVPDHPRLRRDVDRGPRRRQGARRRDDRGAVRQGGPGRPVQDPVPRWPRRVRREAEGRRPRPSRHLHDGARAPAVLLEPRQGVPPAGAGDPRARAHGQGHADRQPAAAAGGRDDPGDHRHPRLRRRAVPVLRHPQGHREEDRVRRLRLVASRRAHRDQPARRRRARAGHRDRRRRRHLHGQPSRHDDPLQRGRRAPDGSHARPACAA